MKKTTYFESFYLSNEPFMQTQRVYADCLEGGHDQNANLDGDVEAAGEEERAIEGERAQARNETLQAVVAETPRPQRQERQNPRIRYAENGHLMINEEEPSMLTCGIVSSTRFRARSIIF
uniref:Uncharacterized protein n=1 Tax=Steinernema glaseri TaxID=37863 RepID=A0A1I7Z0Y6_9BILA